MQLDEWLQRLTLKPEIALEIMAVRASFLYDNPNWVPKLRALVQSAVNIIWLDIRSSGVRQLPETVLDDINIPKLLRLDVHHVPHKAIAGFLHNHPNLLTLSIGPGVCHERHCAL